MTKLTMRNKCTSFAGHFDGHANAWVLCCSDCLMQHGPGLHWKHLDNAIMQLLAPYCPSGRLGNSKQNSNLKIHILCWPIWWPWQCAGKLPCALPNGAGPGLHKKPLDAAIGRVFAPIGAIGHSNTDFFYVFPQFFLFFCDQFIENKHKAKGWPLITIGVWHIELMGSI